jgi:UDP-N-acetylglucosamine acyltransferase
LLAGFVRVDDGAFLGGGSTFHQFMHIGRLVMVQGSSAFGKDLPPFVIAAERNSVFGVNVVGCAALVSAQRIEKKSKRHSNLFT